MNTFGEVFETWSGIARRIDDETCTESVVGNEKRMEFLEEMAEMADEVQDLMSVFRGINS